MSPRLVSKLARLLGISESSSVDKLSSTIRAQLDVLEKELDEVDEQEQIAEEHGLSKAPLKIDNAQSWDVLEATFSRIKATHELLATADRPPQKEEHIKALKDIQFDLGILGAEIKYTKRCILRQIAAFKESRLKDVNTIPRKRRKPREINGCMSAHSHSVDASWSCGSSPTAW